MDWTTVGGFVALAALTVGLIRDVKRDTRRQLDETNRRIGDLREESREAHREQRAEFREAHAQTNRRIDDLRATMVAIIPRAAAEPVDAPAVPGGRGGPAAESAPRRSR